MLRLAIIGAAGLGLLVLTSATALADPGQTNALPTGDSSGFRERMLDWNGSGGPVGDEMPLDSGVAGTHKIGLGLPLQRLTTISSSFGMRSDPFGAGRRLHAGIDLPGERGSPVLASGSGVVRFAKWASGYGNMVEIDHGGGLRTRYGHLLSSNVAPYQTVSAGDVIGHMGSTGRSTGNHLHYEVRIDGRPVQPLLGRQRTVGSFKVLGEAWLPNETSAAPRWRGWLTLDEQPQLPASVIH